MTDVTDVPALAVEPAASAASNEELTEALAGVRRRSQLVVTERWLMVAGAVMMPLGVAFTLLGWYGAAHTTRLFEQVPYLVSGGILGLGLIVIGGARYRSKRLNSTQPSVGRPPPSGVKRTSARR